MSCLSTRPGTSTSPKSSRKGNTIMAASSLVEPVVVGGIDTHADTIHVALITTLGREVADHEFRTTAAGYRAAVTFLSAHGPIDQVGIEGTSSYGAGITRTVLAAGMEVIEVNRPSRSDRRRQGKSDPLDAYHAARAVLSGRATSAPKAESTQAIRGLHNARRSAVKARTATINQITGMLVTAPEAIRTKYLALQGDRLVAAINDSTVPRAGDPVHRAVLTALAALAARHQFLTRQAQELLRLIDTLATAANPGLRAAFGVGPDVAAQLLITAGANPDRLGSEAAFAALCGVCPVPASSGKTTRHRLSRGGDRAANVALYRIALVRMSKDPKTRAYVDRQIAAGRSKKEIIRMLKRAIAREIFRLLTQQIDPPAYADLRVARQAKNITVTAAARAFNMLPTVISRIERGLQRNDDLANRYRTWLSAA
jgi:transposase